MVTLTYGTDLIRKDCANSIGIQRLSLLSALVKMVIPVGFIFYDDRAEQMKDDPRRFVELTACQTRTDLPTRDIFWSGADYGLYLATKATQLRVGPSMIF